MSVAYTIGRIVLPLLFIVAGARSALNVGELAKTLEVYNIPIPDQVVTAISNVLGNVTKDQLLGYAIAVIEIICGLMVLIGLRARGGALVLILYAACTVYSVHHFWDMSGDAMTANLIEALKYLAIIGGLLMVVAIGSGPNTMDRPN